MWLRTFVWTFVSSSRMHSSASSSWWCSSTTRTGGVASTASTSPSTAPAWIPGQRWGGAPNILLLAPYYHCFSGRPLWSPWCPGCRSSCSSWTLSTSPATSTSTASSRRRGETTQVQVKGNKANLNTSFFSPEGDGHEEREDQEPAARQDWILWHHHFRGTLRLLASGLRPEGVLMELLHFGVPY